MRPGSAWLGPALLGSCWSGLKWSRWGELAQLDPVPVHHRVSKLIEPGARVEVVPAGCDLNQSRPMGVTEDQQLYRGVLDQLLLGPRSLPRRCCIDRRSVNAVLAQPRRKPVNQGEAKLGMEGAIYCGGGSAR